jgi:hypothetical protein
MKDRDRMMFKKIIRKLILQKNYFNKKGGIWNNVQN